MKSKDRRLGPLLECEFSIFEDHHKDPVRLYMYDGPEMARSYSTEFGTAIEHCDTFSR